MPYRNTIQNLVESAFVTLSDIAETITYNNKTSSTYNVGTGAVANSTSTYTLKAVVKYLGDKVEGNDKDIAFTGDISVMFASKDLAVVPNTADTVTRDGEVYSINSIKADSVLASYTLNLVRLG